MGGEGQLQVGLTLIELMVVIAMIAIVLAIGIPEYQNFTRSNTLLAEVHILKGDIALARSEAATTGSNVVICPSSDPTSANPSCSNGTSEWNTGWVILAASSATGCTGSGTPFKIQEPLASKNTVVFSTPGNNGSTSSLCFNRNGLPATTTTTANTLSGMFVFNTPDNNPDDRLCLAINGTGHMNILANGQSGCN